MAPRLPIIKATQTIAPTSMAGISVPTNVDPVAKIEEANFNNISARVDKLASFSNKLALKKAETEGAAFGALNAPTAQQIELAAQSGKPITLADLPGNASSISVYQQAAAKGALAVVEDRLEMEGRKALTQLTLESVGDEKMTPEEFGRRLDSVVGSYTSAMSSISSSGAAKLSAGLASSANGQAVTFSRNFATAERKRRKNESLEGVSTLVGDARAIIFGHVPTGEVGADLNTKVDSVLARIRSTLELGGHDETKIKSTLSRAETAISKAKIGVVSEWASSFDNPLSATRQLRKNGAGIRDPRIKDMWSNMNAQERAEARDAVYSEMTALNQAVEIELNQEKLNNEKVEMGAERDFYKALTLADPIEKRKQAKAAIETMALTNEGQAEAMREALATQAGAIADSEVDIQALDTLRANRLLTIKEINKRSLTAKTKGDYIAKIKDQRDELMISAEDMLKGKFSPDLRTPKSQLSDKARIARNKYEKAIASLATARRTAEKTGKPFDPIAIVESVQQTIDRAENAAKRARLVTKFSRHKTMFDGQEQTIEQLRKALTARTEGSFGRSKLKYSEMERDIIRRSISAKEALEAMESGQ